MSDLGDRVGPNKPSSKKTFTDADTRHWLAGPGEIVGPWENVPGAKPAVPAGYDPEDLNYDPLASIANAERMLSDNQQFINRVNAPDRAAGDAAGAREEARLRGRTGIGAGIADAFKEHPVRMIRNVGMSAALPLTAGAGLPAELANGALAAEGVANAVEDPSAMNIGMAALPVIGPAIRGARALGGFGKAAQAVSGYGGKAEGVVHGAEAFADAASRVPNEGAAGRIAAGARSVGSEGRVPYAGHVTPYNPAEAHLPNTPGNSTASIDGIDAAFRDATVQPHMANTSGSSSVGNHAADTARFGPQESLVDRYLPNTPGSSAVGNHGADTATFGPQANIIERYLPNTPGDDLPRALQELSHPGAQRVMDEGFRQNNPVFKQVEATGAFSGNRKVSLPNGPGGSLAGIESATTPPLERNALDAAFEAQTARRGRQQAAGGVNQLMEDGAAKTKREIEEAAILAAHPNRTTRMAESIASDVRPELLAKRQHGTAGFSRLPRLSDAELARMAANIDRIGR